MANGYPRKRLSSRRHKERARLVHSYPIRTNTWAEIVVDSYWLALTYERRLEMLQVMRVRLEAEDKNYESEVYATVW
jgi:hypothetical protein